jgi:hypothetical protein
VFATDVVILGSIPPTLWWLWIAVLVGTLLHVILRRDIRWRQKVLWMIAVVLFPFVAVAAYVVVWLVGRRKAASLEA